MSLRGPIIVRPAPQPWATPASVQRVPHQFRTNWTSTRELLLEEIAHIRLRHDTDPVVMELDVRPEDIRLDGHLRANITPESPRVAVYFSSKYGPLRYECDRYKRGPGSIMSAWQANVRAIALSLEALRAVNRYGVSGHGEQYQGWTAIGSSSAAGGPMTAERAATILRQWGDPFSSDWKSMYRRAVKEVHPDRGGDPMLFREVTAAYEHLGGAA